MGDVSLIEWAILATVLGLMIWLLDWWVLVGIGSLVLLWTLANWTNLLYGI